MKRNPNFYKVVIVLLLVNLAALLSSCNKPQTTSAKDPTLPVDTTSLGDTTASRDTTTSHPSEIVADYQVPVYFDHLPIDFDTLINDWFHDHNDVLIKKYGGMDAFAEYPNVAFASWFYFRPGGHIEGTFKWYLGGYRELPVFAVKSGSIVNASSPSGTIVTVNGIDYLKGACSLKIPKTSSNGTTNWVIAGYWEMLLKKSIYDDPRVAKDGSESGEGYPVTAGEEIGCMQPQGLSPENYGLEFLVKDYDSKHPRLSRFHQYYFHQNPMLFYQDALLADLKSNYQRLYNLATTYKKSPFMFKDGIAEPGTYNNHANSFWGIWYNKTRTLNSINLGYSWNHSMLYMLKGSDCNPETYTVPSGVDGLYVEDYNTAVAVNPAKYIWPPEVWDNSIWYCQVYVKQVSGNDITGILKFTIPHKTYDPAAVKYAKYTVIAGDTNSLFDDTLKIKYFATQAEAEAGMVSGDITTNSHYYEFLRKLPTDNYNEPPN